MKNSKKKTAPPKKKTGRTMKASYWLPLLCGFFLLFLDQATKYYVQAHIPRITHEAQWYPYRGLGVFENFFGIELSIVHGVNSGAAWGLFAAYQPYLLLCRIFFVLAIIAYLFWFNRSKALAFPLTLIVFGAIGNILDYFTYGHVVDMIHFVLWGYDYPSFNVADSTIFIGVWWVFILSLTQKNKNLLSNT